MWFTREPRMPTPEQTLPGRATPMAVSGVHVVTGNPITGPFPEQMASAVFALGCFWGAERLFWQVPGVWTTAVGYAGGTTPNPTYEETCSGRTGHTESVLVVYDPVAVTYEALLTHFWEAHDPTQGMRQGNDVGTQYRSAIFAPDARLLETALESASNYQAALDAAGFPEITTEIVLLDHFYYAEDYHQQYLAKNPAGYCGLWSTGVRCTTPGVFPPTGTDS